MSERKTYQYKGEKNIKVKFLVNERPVIVDFKALGNKPGQHALFTTEAKDEQEMIESSSAFKKKLITVIDGEPKAEPQPTGPVIDDQFAEIEDFNEAVKLIKEAYNITDHSLVNSKAKLKQFIGVNNISLPLIFPEED